MSWDKVGKLLVAVLVGLMVLSAAYALFRGNPRLEASLTYAYLTYPGQFSERISKASDQLKYEQLQGRINSISQGQLSHDQVERLVELAQLPYAQLFAKPFEAGLVDHRTGLLIELHNSGDAPVRQVSAPARQRPGAGARCCWQRHTAGAGYRASGHPCHRAG